MLIESIGKRRFAFGLDWIVQAGKPADVLTDAGVLPSDEPVYAVMVGVPLKKDSGRKARGDEATMVAAVEATTAVGYVTSVDSLRGVVPAAAALSGQADGLYVAQLLTGDWWCVGIQHKLVIAYTDKIGSLDEVVALVNQLRVGLSLDVFTATPTDELLDAGTFDLEASLRRATKAPALTLVATGTSPILPLLIVAGVILLAFGGYRLLFPPAPKLTPEQQRALAKQQYLQSVQGVVGQLPVGPGWLARAYDKMARDLPPFVAGWSLDDVQCRVAPAAACIATYKVGPNQPFALSPLNQRFGTSAVVIGQDGKTVLVTLPVDAKTLVISEPLLRSLRPAMMPLMDWVGAIPLGMAGAKIDGQMLVRHLDQEFGASAAGMPPLFLESLTIKGDSFLDDLTLRPVLQQGSRGGFVPVMATWSYGNTQGPAGWTITWERIHG